MTNKLSKLYGYPCELWHDLADNPAMSHVLNANSIPSTVLLQSMRDIGCTYNRKFRNRKIDVLITTLTKLGSKLLPALKRIGDVLLLNYMNNDTLPDVNVWTVSNSPSYLPYLVGDSSYWVSCLRSGVLNAMTKGTYEYDTLDWRDTDGTVEMIILHGRGYAGCNEEYLPDEYKAFNNGELMYLTVGKFFNEDVNGPRARMRIHLTNHGGKFTATMDRVYSVDFNETLALYNKARELYGDSLYSVGANNGVMVNQFDVLSMNAGSGVYTDYYDAYKVVDMLTQQTGNVCIRRSRHNGSTVSVIEFTKNGYKTMLRTGDYVDTINTHCSTLSCIRQSNTELRLYSDEVTVLRKLFNHVGLVVSYNHETGNTIIKPHSNINIQYEYVRWKARGYEYTLTSSLVLYRRKLKPFGERMVYNIKRGTWVDSYRSYSVREHYTLTRHTIHTIYKFLPYAKYKSNRVHPMPVV